MDLANLERTLQARTPGLMDARRSYAVLVPLVEREGELWSGSIGTPQKF